jgi:superfamily II DNA or RNA helicase
VLLVSPTGSGKTVVFAELIRRLQASEKRIFVLVHRRELTKQASDKLSALGIAHGIVQAGFEPQPWLPVQVVAVQTFNARVLKSQRLEIDPPDVIVVDEAHHIVARTYRAIINRHPDALIIGITATPCRGDGRGLGGIFQRLIETVDIPALVGAGHLVPIVTYAPSQPDLESVHVRRGDYVQGELEAAVNTAKLVGDIVEHWLRIARGRPTVVFGTTVKHSIHIRDCFCEAGIMAEHLDGNKPVEERDAILAKLASGQIDVLTNCAVLTEGWDCPAVSCIVLARPTKSLGLFRQMAGRGLRPGAGKSNLLLLDHAGATWEHGLIADPIAWDLDEGRKAVNQEHSSRSKGHKPRLTTCPECSGVRMEGQPCPACGWLPPKRGQAFDVIDGELGEVGPDGVKTPKYTAEEKKVFYRGLLWIAQERSYKPGWAAHKAKEKFGTWPASNNVSAAPPDPAVRSWVKSRQIAYAKARQNAGSERRFA